MSPPQNSLQAEARDEETFLELTDVQDFKMAWDCNNKIGILFYKLLSSYLALVQGPFNSVQIIYGLYKLSCLDIKLAPRLQETSWFNIGRAAYHSELLQIAVLQCFILTVTSDYENYVSDARTVI